MSILFARGGIDEEISHEEMRDGLYGALRKLGVRRRVLAVPPDFTRYESQAGILTRFAYDLYGEALVDVMPALGTHRPVGKSQRERMFPGVPADRSRAHDWRREVVTLGELPASFVERATEGTYREPWSCQLNRLLTEGGHDLILSIGQVVPHEVAGMANYTKNLFIGTGGASAIHISHFISAVYGIERTLGRADTPVRRLLNEAWDRFATDLPVVFVLTVVGRDPLTGRRVVRGLFIGDHHDCFEAAADLSVAVNIELLDERPRTVVCYLDPDEFRSTWLGNKAIYRTRMAIADGGELVVLAPGVECFGEDPDIDTLIRRYGYRTTPEVLALVEDRPDLAANLATAAHLIHGTTEGRFRVTYCPGGLSRSEVELVRYNYGDPVATARRYDPERLEEGWNDVGGDRIFFVSNPGQGLWAHRSHFD